MTTAASNLDRVARMCADVLMRRPSGAFSDFDGTLSEVAPTPDEAVIFEGARDAFARVALAASVAGIITGRAVDDARSRVDVDGLMFVGNHGLEWYEDGKRVDHEAGLRAEAGILRTLERTEQRLKAVVSLDGLLFENKRLSASIHYRNAPDPVSVGAQLLPIVEEEAEANGLRISGGKMLVELRPIARVSKGTALEQAIRTHNLKGVIFIGDDVTDVDGFKALNRMRVEEGLATAAIAIRSKDVHPDVIAESDAVLEGVHETVGLLDHIADLMAQE